MRRKKKIIRIIVRFFVYGFLVILSGDLYLESIGAPPTMKHYLNNQLKQHGLDIEIGRITGGVFTGLVIHNAVLNDPELPQNLPVLSISTLYLKPNWLQLLQGQWPINKIHIAEASIGLPLNEQNIIIFNDIYLEANWQQNQLKLSTFFARFKNNLSLTIQGSISNISPQKTISQWNYNENRLFSFHELIDNTFKKNKRLYNLLIEMYRTITETRHAKLNIVFKADHDFSKGLQLQSTLYLDHVPYRGLKLDKGIILGQYQDNTVILSKLQLTMTEETERLEGSLQFLVDKKYFSGNINYQGSLTQLHKLLSTLSKHRLPFSSPKSNDKLTLHNVRIYPSPLHHPLDWHIAAELNGEDIHYLDGVIKKVTGRISLKDRNVKLANASVVFSPAHRLSGELSYNLNKQQLALKAKGQSNPRILAGFIKDPPRKKRYLNLWKDFKWHNDHPPYFDISLVYFPTWTRNRIDLKGKAEMKNFTYNTVPIAQAQTQCFYQSNRFCTLDDLRIQCYDKTVASAILQWDFEHPRKTFRFTLNGQLDPSLLLTLIRRSWHDKLSRAKLQFPNPPHLEGSGQLYLSPPHQFKMDGSINAPNARFHNIKLKENQIRLSYSNHALGTTINSQHIDITAKEQHSPILLNDTEIHLIWDDFRRNPQSTTVSALNSRLLTIDKLQLRQLHSSSGYYEDNAFFIHTNARQSSYQQAKSKAVSFALSIDIPDQHILFDIHNITALNIADKYQFLNLSSQGEWTKQKFTFHALDAKTGRHRLADKGYGIASDIKAEGQYQNATLELQRITARTYTKDALSVQGIDLSLHYKDGIGSGHFQAQSTEAKHGYHSQKIKGMYRWIDRNTLHFSQTHIKRIHIKNISTLDDIYIPKAIYHLDKNQTLFSFQAQQATLYKLPLSKISSSDCKYDFNRSELSLHKTTGRLLKGHIHNDLFYDINNDKGKLKLTVKDVNLMELLQHLNSSPKANAVSDGQISGNADLTFQLTQNDQLNLYGDGTIRLKSEKNITEIPLITQLIKSITNRNFGRINQFDAQLQFLGEHIHIPKLQSNGTILSIRSKGDYWWRSGKIDFHIKAYPFQSVPVFGVFPWLLSRIPLIKHPFALLFERRLTGTIQNPKW